MYRQIAVIAPSIAVADRGTVRIGALSPSLPTGVATPASVKDSEKVRIGALSPAMPVTRQVPASVADGAKVRIGALSPGMPASPPGPGKRHGRREGPHRRPQPGDAVSMKCG